MEIVLLEKAFIEKNYNTLNCEIKGTALYCYGSFQPSAYSATYTYRIKYAPPKPPKVNIQSPTIEYNDDIHMYAEDNSLCLYHKTDLTWGQEHHLYDTIVPWTHEWFVFYELYQITGKWEHPFVPHKAITR